MTIEEALAILDKVLPGKPLNNLQELVLRGVWQGQSYPAIAQSIDYEPEYIKQIGAQIWQLLTQALGEKVTKSNIQSILRRYQDAGEFLDSSTTPQLPTQNLKSIDVVANGVSTIPNRQDWGEAIDVSTFFGRTSELATIQQWIVSDSPSGDSFASRCRLVLLLGMGGIGKTSLSVKLAQQIQGEFEYLIWRSLRNAPPVLDILAELIEFLSDRQETELPSTLDGRILRLMKYLRSHRCLIILDNAESILQDCDRTGRYLEGYEGYEQLFSCIGETFHQSCLLLTSREKPKGIAAKEGETLPIRSLSLKGLSPAEARQIFQAKGTYTGSDSEWESVISQYAGNPLALKMIAPAIQDFFAGSVSNFLQFFQQGTLILDDIRDLLERQFNRLTYLEQEIMYWLAIERKPVSLGELQDDFVTRGSPNQLLDALASLQRRSFIEKSATGFTQQPVVMEYITLRLIEQVCQEIATEDFGLLMSHALIKATGNDYIRNSQIRVILEAIANKLQTNFTFHKGLEHKLNQVIGQLKKRFSDSPGYGGGNLINLLNQLKINLTNYDFSHLTIWQADLRQVNLHNVNFAHSDLTKSVFAETFSGILSVAISPCGHLLATGDANSEIRLWTIADGKQLFTLKGHKGWVSSLAFSPDASTLISSSIDYSLKLWDVNTGECLKTLEGHSNLIWSVDSSPDGKTLASGSADATVKLWDTVTGKCWKTLQGHNGWVHAVAYSPDGKTLISGSLDRTVRVWHTQTGECLQIYHGHTDQIWAVAFSPDGKTIASGSFDTSVKLWDTSTGECWQTLQGHKNWIYALAFSPDSQTLASGSVDTSVKIWHVQTGQCLKTLQGHISQVWSVAFTPDGTTLVSGSFDQTVKLWDVRTGQRLKSWQGYTNQINAVAFSPDSKTLVSCSEDPIIRLWDVQTGQCLQTLSGHTSQVWSVKFSPDGKTIASGSFDKIIRIWDAVTGKCLNTLQGHTNWVHSVAYSPDGKTLASGSLDQTVRLWDIATGECLHILEGHTSQVWAVEFHPQESILASGCADQTVRFWDVGTGQCLKIVQQHPDWVYSVAFSPDGRTIASSSADRTVKLWNVDTDRCHQTLQGHTNWVFSVAWSPDGKTLASGSFDFSVRLWDVHTGECLKICQEHNNQVRSVAFSPQGTILASGSTDETIKIWDVNTGECLKTLRPKRPYEGMNITGAIGLTQAQKATMKALGAVELS